MSQLVRHALIFLLAAGLRNPIAARAQGPASVPQGAIPPAAGWPEFTSPVPGAQPAFAPASYQANVAAEDRRGSLDGEVFEPAQIIAQVGDQYILRGELLGDANLTLCFHYQQLDKMPPEQREAARREVLELREQIITKKLLQQAIDRKLKFIEFLRSLPPESDPKKLDERWKRIQGQAAKMFAENLDEMVAKLRDAEPDNYAEIARQSEQLYRVALAMKEFGIPSREDPGLERMLRSYGTSVQKQQLQFMEYALGQAAVRQQVDFRPEITHEQLVEYYREHESEFFVSQRVRWEQLSVLFQRIPEGPESWDAICAMGNQVLYGGAPLWAIAKRSSHEKMSSKGGFHDWTSFGDLTLSKSIHDAVFALPINELSPVIRDGEGLHIVRVLERQEAHQTPFVEVQSQIKEKLQNEALQQAYADFVAKLRDKTPVFTEFGQPSAGGAAQPASFQSSGRR